MPNPLPPGLSPELFHRLDKVADAVNPALTLWAALALRRHAQATTVRVPLGRTLVVWLGAILLVFVAAHLNRWLHLWPEHKLFPSGHISYAACLATLGASIEPRSLWLSVPLIGLYSLLIVLLGFHVWLDIFGALALAPTLTILALRLLAPPRIPAIGPER